MNRISVVKFAVMRMEPRGIGVKEKFWIQQNGKYQLVKISEPSVDQDIIEFLSSMILKEIGVSCVNVTLGYDNYTDKNCCLVDSFLTKEGDVSYEITGWQFIRRNTMEEELELCVQQVFQKYASLYGITEQDLFKIKRDYIRNLFGKCIINNFDTKLGNVGIIYNEKEDSYRLPPAFDNGCAFKDYNSFNDPICFVGEQFFSVSLVIDYILEFYYEDVADIIENLSILVDGKLVQLLNSFKEEIVPAKLLYIDHYLRKMNLELHNKKNKTR